MLRMRPGTRRRALSWCLRRRRSTIWGLIGRLCVPMATAAVVGATPKCGARFRILTPDTIIPNARARPTTVKQGLVAFEVKKWQPNLKERVLTIGVDSVQPITKIDKNDPDLLISPFSDWGGLEIWSDIKWSGAFGVQFRIKLMLNLLSRFFLKFASCNHDSFLRSPFYAPTKESKWKEIVAGNAVACGNRNHDPNFKHFYATISLIFSLEVIYAAILIVACWHEQSTMDAKTAQMLNPSQCAIGSNLLALFYTHH